MARFPAERRSRWRRNRSERWSTALGSRRPGSDDRAQEHEAVGDRPAAPRGEAGVPASSRPPKTPPTLGSASRIRVLRSDSELDEARSRAAEQLRRITEAMGPVARRAQSQMEANRSSGERRSPATSSHGEEAGDGAQGAGSASAQTPSQSLASNPEPTAERSGS